MRKINGIILRIISLLLVFGFIIVLPAFVPTVTVTEVEAKVTEAQIKAAKDKITANQKKIKELNADLSKLEGDITEALAEKEKIEQEVGVTFELVEQTEQVVNWYEGLIAEKEATIATRQAEIQNKTESFRELLRVSYENGKQTYLELLVSSENVIDFLTRTDNLGAMLSYQEDLVSELDKEVKTLSAMKDDLDVKKAEQVEALEEQKEAKALLDEQLKAQEKFLARLEKNQEEAKIARDKAVSSEGKYEKELENLIEKQRQEEAADRGKAYLWPLPTSNIKITSLYGWRDLYGTRDYHKGIDISASYGTDIYAAKGGTVEKAAYDSGYGYYVLIDHGNGKATRYAHMSKICCKSGEKVTRGQLIGKVGSTGHSYGNHLHFETIDYNRKYDTNARYTYNPLQKNAIVITKNGKEVDVLTDGILKYYL